MEHLFVVDIEFNIVKANAKTLMYNEIYTPIFEKKKNIDPSERSVFHLSETLRTGTEDHLLYFKNNKKTHATMSEKEFIPLYLEHLNFLIKRAGWQVTKIYLHYTFA